MVRKVNVKLLSIGLSLANTDGREWKINQLLFAEYMTLVADSDEKLCHFEEFGRVFRMNLGVNENE